MSAATVTVTLTLEEMVHVALGLEDRIQSLEKRIYESGPVGPSGYDRAQRLEVVKAALAKVNAARGCSC